MAAASAAVAVRLLNTNTSSPHSPTCLRFHSASSWTPMPFTAIKALRLPTPTSYKLFCLVQQTTIQEEEEEEKEKEEEGCGPSVPTPKLYVSNLPYGCDASEVRGMFQRCGKVISVELIMDKQTGRSRGFVFVTMGTVEDARTAIRNYDGFELGGRDVRVRFANSTRLFPDRRSSDPDLNNYIESSNRIYCGNLAWTVTSRSLREFFNINGTVLGAKVMYEPLTGRSLGYGFISFATQSDVKDAIAALNGKDLEGRPVQLKRVKTTKNSAPMKKSATEENSIPQEIVKE